jgi:hypothetical protein
MYSRMRVRVHSVRLLHRGYARFRADSDMAFYNSLMK